jgi:hypothetical protein
MTLSPDAVQRLPSGPTVIARGSAMSATANATAASGLVGENLATPPGWVTQRLPSGPAVIPVGLFRLTGLNCVTVPSGAILATSLVASSVTHTLASGPIVIWLFVPTPPTANRPSTTGSAATGPTPTGTAIASTHTMTGRRTDMGVLNCIG